MPQTPEQRRVYRQTEAYKIKKRAYRATPKHLAHRRIHRLQPDVRARERQWKRKPDACPTQTILYVMTIDEIPGVYKIGRCSDLERRRRALNRCHSFNLRVVANYPDCGRLELPVHDLLAPYLKKTEGSTSREWFKCSLGHIHNTIQSVITKSSSSFH